MIDRFRVQIPYVAHWSIGAGGGSIARIVNGQLKVGPDSAGSNPGPACYDRGGEEPTVTDADLVLGYIDPETSFSAASTEARRRPGVRGAGAPGSPTPLGIPVRRSGVGRSSG